MRQPTVLETKPERPPRVGFALPRDILIAPARAFAEIAATHEWLPALLIIAVSTAVGITLLLPAELHLIDVQARSDPSLSNASAAQLASMHQSVIAQNLLTGTLSQVLVCSLIAFALTTAARIRGLATPYAAFFSLAANCSIPMALGTIVQGAIVRLHDPATITNAIQLLTAYPLTLASVAPLTNDRQAQFLSEFDPFFLWSFVLLGYGYAALTATKLQNALFLSFGIGLGVVLLFLFIQQ